VRSTRAAARAFLDTLVEASVGPADSTAQIWRAARVRIKKKKKKKKKE
jgi:hypothetical protein